MPLIYKVFMLKALRKHVDEITLRRVEVRDFHSCVNGKDGIPEGT